MTSMSRIEPVSSPPATENLNGWLTVSIRPRNSPPSAGRSGSVISSPSMKLYVTRAVSGIRSPCRTLTESVNESPRAIFSDVPASSSAR